jgi:prepilin-type N-terminal cleavage/methylation domain-containing protein
VKRSRTGYTLVEVVLVMAILVIVAAIAIPSLTGMLSSGNLEAAEDTVKAQLTKARNKAKEEGCSYKFCIKVNTGSYRIAPDSDEYWGGTGGSANSSNSNSSAPEGKVIEGKLPEKVCFSPPQGLSKSDGAGSDWSTVATFLSDGTAVDDAQVGIAVEGHNPLLINLKGATGSISSAPK